MAVGKSVSRVDAYEKVTGRAKFTDDLAPKDCLTGKVLHATIANGLVTRIDTSAAEALDGVVRVVTFADVPDTLFPTPGHPWSVEAAHQDVCDRPLLTRRVRLYGDDIAAVVAVDEITANRALQLIHVEYEEYPPLTTPVAALADTSHPLHEAHPDNILAQSEYEYGDVEAALAAADVVAEGDYRTPMIQHCHLEPPISWAYMEKGRVVCVTSTQIPHIVRRVIGQALGIPWGNVRVIKPYIGGGFGNKQDVLYEPINCFLTMQVGGRPVKVEMTREETFLCSRTRHAIAYHLRAGATKDGKLVARDMDAVSNQGGYASHGHGIVANGATAWRHMYNVPNIRARAKTVYTNTPTGGAMRGYGIPQMCFASEALMDDLAAKTGMDPLEFRLKNIHEGYFADPVFKPIAANTNGLRACMERGAAYIRWQEKRRAYAGQEGSLRRGVGMAIFSYKTGVWPISLEVAGARLSLNQDGSFQMALGATEIGQGADTVLSQMAADALGVEMGQIHIESAQDTDFSPFDTGAYASRQTYVTGWAVRDCAALLRDKILAYARRLLGNTDAELALGGAWVLADSEPAVALAEVAQNAYYSLEDASVLTAEVSRQTKDNALAFGACFAEVEVDIPLGKVRVLDIINVHDSGRLINPQLAEMQVQGGMSMAIGYGLSEQMLVDPRTGRLRNGTLLDYKLPTMLDAPDLAVDFVEIEEPTGPFGNKALGEPPAIPCAPAIRNAVLHATGVAINEIPLSPQRVVEAFGAAGLL